MKGLKKIIKWKKERQTSDHCFIRSRKLSQPTKKTNPNPNPNPLVFTVKKLLWYPEYKIQKITQWKRTEMATKIKKETNALRFASNGHRICLQIPCS